MSFVIVCPLLLFEISVVCHLSLFVTVCHLLLFVICRRLLFVDVCHCLMFVVACHSLFDVVCHLSMLVVVYHLLLFVIVCCLSSFGMLESSGLRKYSTLLLASLSLSLSL